MDLESALSGDPVRGGRNEPTPPSISERVQTVVDGHWFTTTNVTDTHRRSYEIAAEEFSGFLSELRNLIEVDLKRVEDAAESAGAPWTPGRVPRWTKE
jgi:hypothetical protein